ncbi:MAG TPA: four helix bundle protein [Candidatus Moranbacteria bacterium]|nr:four helix bundle protein [Candidatus Moranbacteria bacterium]
MLHSYKELVVWQKSMDLVTEIYNLTDEFPREEVFGLTSQIRRSAISIPSNIAEGRYRGRRKDFLQFLRIAYASGAELETQIEIAKRLKKTGHLDFSTVDSLLLEIMKMLNKIICSMRTN